ncbi:SDR family NAD(P)-dependent oxidoreductase [Pseudonocardia acidicola]|uniref:SDR family NAD(P)-dependent oxidoreductase n=1 Tax=Pseudonocardia acidicola TaxID=2724939 RepID=A0ABX1SHY0_9PSEU|nr:SDR family NAD(P)-dependent oxidoreductase [Pseudonocardia acidicola]NMI00403.1 SDR family NAD(P)-dependent oxidoreductase [Pseudonocardia acidicola]
MDLQLTGKRAVVTGGSRGIGFAIADALAAEGVDVALIARHPDTLQAAATDVARHGGRALALVADTADDESVRGMVRTAAEQMGGIDILVNAAARPASAGPTPSLAGLTDDDVRIELETKLLGYLRCARAVAPYMIEQGWGRIINVSGLNARKSASLVGAVRNVAVAAMTGALAAELGPKGINVTVVHPGLTVTERTPAMIAELARARDVTEEEAEALLAATTTVGRLITAEEVADVVTFLASPRSVAVNGDAIAAGGGTPGVIHY